MATVKCPLGKRGSPSHEWHDGEKSRIYCQGWEDKRTDEPLDACLNCPDHVSKAQDDLEKWQAEHGNNLQIAAKKRMIDANAIERIADKGMEKYPRRYLAWERLKYLVSKCPTVNAVEIPDCSKCIYNGRIENWDQCEHCIGNTHRINNFVSIEEVTNNG